MANKYLTIFFAAAVLRLALFQKPQPYETVVEEFKYLDDAFVNGTVRPYPNFLRHERATTMKYLQATLRNMNITMPCKDCPNVYLPVCTRLGSISGLAVTIHVTTDNVANGNSLRSGPNETKKLINCTMCPRLYQPLCASNGKWYHNPCFMACEIGDARDVKILYKGECKPKDRKESKNFKFPPKRPNCNCPDYEDPVCSRNGKWFTNRCFLECHQEEKSWDTSICPSTPPPESKCPCPDVTRPICGMNGKWYRNTCFLDCDHMDTSPDDNKCPATERALYQEHFSADCANCSKVYDPVCASNGNYYHNPCMFECMVSLNEGVMILYHGKCITY